VSEKRNELHGWLLDVFPNVHGLTLWLLGQDGKRHALHHDFPIAFYAAGPTAQLRALWKWLLQQPEAPRLAREERCDLFTGFIPVVSVELTHPTDLSPLFTRAAQTFPDLTYYNADIPISLRYAARYGVFPLADCVIQINPQEHITDIRSISSPWELDQPLPPLTVLGLEPECDPLHATPTKVHIQTPHARFTLDLEPARVFIISLCALLKRHDPDLLLTSWGDTWLLPRLLQMSKETGIELPLNRDPDQSIKHREARTYYAYGQVIHRGRQVLLAGRWHIDIHNAVMYHDYGLEGIWELARVTGLPVQTVARVSPGTGISSMQIVTALRDGVLVPWHKQQAEHPKSVLDLIRSDMGGLVFQPTIGLHKDVAEIDFISMYPSVMARFNISPETIQPGIRDPQTGLPATSIEQGLIPKTLEPLLKKRIAIKMQLLSMSKWDIRYKRYKAQAAAHKWLLVTCFGYLGYKNARFGRIEAHEAVTAYGREALLRAKEVAEDMGFTVLHMYVDGLWVQRQGSNKVQDFQPLLDEILNRTGLPIALDGIYRWISFLPSRLNKHVPVANRYFGVFQSGEIKCRGIELRRHDTPAFVAETQREVLDILARSPDVDGIFEYLPRIQSLIEGKLYDLRHQRIPLKKLIVCQTLSRPIIEYRVLSPSAIAAKQLEDAGKFLRPGQTVRFIYTLGEPGVHAWDLEQLLDPKTVDIHIYKTLLNRAMETLMQSFGFAQIQPLLPWFVSNVGNNHASIKQE
jgi:DNA polymerase-2